MEKNWLIRTKSNHILGPVSKDKVLELYHNGTVKPDDEICSGNGFWFYIREDDMVGRYLSGSEIQGFNPISEAKDVLTAGINAKPAKTTDDVTQIGTLNISMLKEDKTPPPSVMSPEVIAPVDEEIEEVIEESAGPQSAPVAEAAKPELGLKKKSRSDLSSRKASQPRQKKALKKQSYLKVVAFLCFVTLLALVYFRRTIINSLFHGEVSLTSLIISESYAQEDIPEKKKSSLNNKSSWIKLPFAPR